MTVPPLWPARWRQWPRTRTEPLPVCAVRIGDVCSRYQGTSAIPRSSPRGKTAPRLIAPSLISNIAGIHGQWFPLSPQIITLCGTKFAFRRPFQAALFMTGHTLEGRLKTAMITSQSPPAPTCVWFSALFIESDKTDRTSSCRTILVLVVTPQKRSQSLIGNDCSKRFA